MKIDHIFIFSNNDAEEAGELVNTGFTEGSRRKHPGQGTANRKFYFDNFFLEILYVTDQAEITNDVIGPIKLWKRSNFEPKGTSRFGLCVVNDDDTDNLFAQALEYQPSYFPEGNAINIITNEENPQLPWTFQLPFKGQNRRSDEPTEHRIGAQHLTKATFGIADLKNTVSFVEAFEASEQIDFELSQLNQLKLVFDNGQQGGKIEFKDLNLLIEY
ncbi:MAG: VOC family protein [Bacteroidota bacterium]